jgi:hypothetical protein
MRLSAGNLTGINRQLSLHDRCSRESELYRGAQKMNAHLSNWFFMMPSIATKFQYVNSLLFSFSLTTIRYF